MTFLLDVNILIALIDPAHIGHDSAHDWFEAGGQESWATCPLTENAVIRIAGHPKYPGAPGSPATIASIVAGLRTLPGHVFWPDDISLVSDARVDVAQIRPRDRSPTATFWRWPWPMEADWRHSIADYRRRR